MNLLRAYWDRFLSFYRQLDQRQRIILLVGAVGIAAIGIGAMAIINNVQYGVLYAGLESGEASRKRTSATAWKTAERPSMCPATGSTI